MFEAKAAAAIAKLVHFCPAEGYYVANSGGKDSTVLRDLVLRSGVKADFHYNLTTVDPPELVRFIRREHPETINHRPKLSMWQLIVKKRMPPTRVARYCCEYLKENVAESVGRMVLTGIRWQESRSRGRRKMLEACTRKFLRKTYFHPIIDWTEDEIWGYIRGHKIPYCSLYDQGYRRLGCVMCPMAGAKRQISEGGKFPRIRAAYVAAFSRMIDKRREDGLPTQWLTGEEVMAWWTSPPKRNLAPAVTILDHDDDSDDNAILKDLA